MPLLSKSCEYVYLLEEIENTPTGLVKIGSTGIPQKLEPPNYKLVMQEN